jgi:hypothetical protein
MLKLSFECPLHGVFERMVDACQDPESCACPHVTDYGVAGLSPTVCGLKSELFKETSCQLS